jgi:hypothetical protein
MALLCNLESARYQTASAPCVGTLRDIGLGDERSMAERFSRAVRLEQRVHTPLGTFSANGVSP